jgi:hypothetical protein
MSELLAAFLIWLPLGTLVPLLIARVTGSDWRGALIEASFFATMGLIVFPILIALFFVLREVVTGDIAASTYGFIQSLPAIREIIANPEAFDPTLFGYFHMAEPSIILAVFAGAFQYFQAKQITPQNPSKDDPTARMGGTMVKVLPVITVVIASTLPSALALYWGASSAIAVVQQHFVLQSEVTLMQKLRLNGKGNGKLHHASHRLESLQRPVVVCGGAGFLGSHLCERLLAQGREVICVDNFFTGSRRNVEHLVHHPVGDRRVGQPWEPSRVE